ncbi:glycoside hydrolase family 3 C-terminal domain-containing protein [Pendulispora brunnea]|uniref:beta-glucosidase n=1 Tax=Pendulispora brunnea TaxID=2905690 RepID=A0ABZ2KBW1_9BACT
MRHLARLPRGLVMAAATLSSLVSCSSESGPRDAEREDTAEESTSAFIGAEDAASLEAKLDARVRDLLARMTLDEKIGQMTQAERTSFNATNPTTDIRDYGIGSILSGGGSTPEGNTPEAWRKMVDEFQKLALSSRLGIPLLYGADAVHGHGNVYGATVFPHNLGLGASRNANLVRWIGRATAEEVSATGVHWTFSPCLCVVQDERWGRSYESFGEEPEIATSLSAIIDGYQGLPGRPGSILAAAKHYVGDGGTKFGTSTTENYLIDQGDTQVSEAELRARHLPPFKAAVARGVSTVMASFSSWNGTKMHAQKYLLTDVLKKELGFKGFIVSDWHAIEQIPGDYPYQVRTSINAGIDMVMVPFDYKPFITTLKAEVQAGNVAQSRIDDAVSRILREKFRFGLFEHPYSSDRYADSFGSKAHRALARKAVQESLVLLKNEGRVLPLASHGTRILVAGTNADDLGNQAGGWTITWQGMSGHHTMGTTILEGIRQTAGKRSTVDYVKTPTAEQSSGYDVGIVVVGETPYAEGPGDRADLPLRAEDQAAIDNVCGATKCVVVVVSGRPLILTDRVNTMNALVAAWLPGTEGQGVADVLFGRRNFVGKLPITWPKSISQLPSHKDDPGYDPLFPYGFGLKY